MNPGDFFIFGIDVLKTVVKGAANTILVQVGDAVQQVTEGELAEWWQHVGFISKTPRPVAGKQAAQAMGVRHRNRDVFFASRDQRGQDLAGTLDDGETCVYAAGPDGTAQARILLKKDGSINLYTRAGNTSGGAGMVIQVDAANDAIRILNSVGYGIIIDSDGVQLTAGGTNAGLTLGSDGTATLVSTGQTQVDGATILLGSTAVPVVNAALKGPTGISGSPSLKTIIE